MPLNDRQIKAAKPSNTGKKIKLFDGNSLYLEVTPAGGKIFRMRYRMNGKDKDFTIGKYPAVSLVEARQATENARRMIAQGQDPTKAKQEAEAARQAALLNTFEHLAKQWHEDNLPRWKEHHAERIMRYLKNDVFPVIGEIPVNEIKVTHIKTLLDSVMARGVISTNWPPNAKSRSFRSKAKPQKMKKPAPKAKHHAAKPKHHQEHRHDHH